MLFIRAGPRQRRPLGWALRPPFSLAQSTVPLDPFFARDSMQPHTLPTFSKTETTLLHRLRTPAQVQDFLDTIPMNFETDGKDTAKSPIRVLREWNAHCLEGAMLGAYILSLHGFPPLLMHLKTIRGDWDHVVAPFRVHGYWGALSKTNHAVLRYREPVYKTVRELALSYFHEYFTDNGVKTLRSYSRPINLNRFEDTWPVDERDLWGIDEELSTTRHYLIAPKEVIRKLRRADAIEREAGKIIEWPAP